MGETALSLTCEYKVQSAGCAVCTKGTHWLFRQGRFMSWRACARHQSPAGKLLADSLREFSGAVPPVIATLLVENGRLRVVHAHRRSNR